MTLESVYASMMIIIGAESGRLSCPLSLFSSTRHKEEKKAPLAECCWAFGLHNISIFHVTRRKKAALPERRRRPQQWGRRTLCCHRRGWAFGPRARERRQLYNKYSTDLCPHYLLSFTAHLPPVYTSRWLPRSPKREWVLHPAPSSGTLSPPVLTCFF